MRVQLFGFEPIRSSVIAAEELGSAGTTLFRVRPGMLSLELAELSEVGTTYTLKLRCLRLTTV